MEINFSKKQVNWLTKLSEEQDIPIEKLVQGIVNDFMVQFNKNKETPKNEEVLQVKTEVIQFILNSFKELYFKRFKIKYNFSLREVDLLKAFYKDLINNLNDEQEGIDILVKAFTWYLYVHDSVGPNGEKYPYKLNIFLEQEWLWTKCIQQSQKLDMNVFLKAQEKGMTPEQLANAIKKGDIGIEKENAHIPALLEEALIQAEELVLDLSLGREFKKHPMIKELYMSGTPSEEYIRKAVNYMNKLKEETVNA